MEIAKANKTASVITNDPVFLIQLCELLIINPLYDEIFVITDVEQTLESKQLRWFQVKNLTQINTNQLGNRDDVFCRVRNNDSIENYNTFLFTLLKNCSLQEYARAYINIDLFQYLQKGSLSKLLSFQMLEEQILKLPFWSANVLVTVKTNSVDTKALDESEILKTGRRYIGMKLLSSLGLPLIVIPSLKIAKAMDLMTYSLNQGSKIFHSDDIQKLLNNAKDRN